MTLAAAIAAVVLLKPSTQPLLRATLQNWNRIDPGMTRSQVEAILGPAGRLYNPSKDVGITRRFRIKILRYLGDQRRARSFADLVTRPIMNVAVPLDFPLLDCRKVKEAAQRFRNNLDGARQNLTLPDIN